MKRIHVQLRNTSSIHDHANVDYIRVASETIKRIGYDKTEYDADYHGCAVMMCYDKQSRDIAHGVDEGAGITRTRSPVTMA